MDFLNEINAKFIELEAEANRKWEKARAEEEKLLQLDAKYNEQSANLQLSQKALSYEEARARNANLLKAIEKAKARLRSRSTFSPVEQILAKAIENYKRDLVGTLKNAQSERSPEDNIYEVLQ